MRSQRLTLVLAAALLAAFAATLGVIIPLLIRIEEPINIVVVSDVLTWTMTTFAVAAAHAVLLGLPLFLLVRRKMGHAGIVACALGGFIVAAVPFGALALISMIGTQFASSNGRPTVINGVPTLAGWIEYALIVGWAGVLGLVGGFVFWTAIRTSGSRAHSWSVVSAAAVLTCGVFILPIVVKDRSCHNLFRDGRTSVGPQVYAELKVPPDDWTKLAQIFAGFGDAHGLSVRGDQQLRDGRITWRGVDLCNDAGISIEVYDEPWLKEVNSPRADKGMRLSIFSLKPDTDWKPLARQLLGEIETNWPTTITYRGPSGQSLSFEDAMNGRQ